MNDALIASLVAAVESAPDDMTLRLHLAELLVSAGRGGEAVPHVATVLARDPSSADARRLMQHAMGGGTDPTSHDDDDAPNATGAGEFDWTAAEDELGDVVGPMYVDSTDRDPAPSAYEPERAGVRLADVGGLDEVKQRLEASFLAPLRNPELRTLYGKSLRGGLILYGPPGCGKTFMARAVAGELGARFLHVSLADVLDMYIGQSERNVKELFEVARSSSPCVLFLDELDAIGQKRSLTRSSGTRNTVNQLLTELDGVGSDNEGVFVLGATNHPWDIDPALRRPGRFDRILLVLPPDLEAREAILRTHLRGRPIEGIDTRRLAKQTDGLSGADLAHLCESASEQALLESVRTGETRMITMADFTRTLGEVRPSIGSWVETARNVALYANPSGEYDELARWIRKRRR